jgi:predicted acetyltransferase
MNLKLIPINIQDRNILRDMIRDYQQEILGGNPAEYKYLHTYWQKSDSHPYFIKNNEELVGFILINSYTLVSPDANSISELYVKKEFRKNNFGKEAAKQAFGLFPGKWEVREIKDNPSAHAF